MGTWAGEERRGRIGRTGLWLENDDDDDVNAYVAVDIRRLCNESTGDSPKAIDRVMGEMFKDGRILTLSAAGGSGKDIMIYEEAKLYRKRDQGVGCRAIKSSDGNV